jgi:hypothetical protein
MAYQTGTSTGPADLLDKLRLWLIDIGWTVNKWEDDNTKYHTWSGLNGTGKRLHVQKAAVGDGTVMYFNFRSTIRGMPWGDHQDSQTQISGKYRAEITGLAMYGSTGYNAGLAWDLQPGGTLNSAVSWGVSMTELSTTAIPAYYFFSDGDTITVAIEYSSGKYQFFCFGCLEKQGAYTGGQFFFGSLYAYEPTYELLNAGSDQTMFLVQNYDGYTYGNGAVYLEVDSSNGWRASGRQGQGTGTNYLSLILCGLRSGQSVTAKGTSTTANSFVGYHFTRSPNFYNGLAPFAPSYVLGKRASGNFSLLGWPKSIRHINATNYQPMDEIVLGSDTWVFFPAHSKSDADPSIGFVIKKVV